MTTSNPLPFDVSVEYLDREIRGIFGRFQTKHSYSLNYVLASLPFSSIELLTTAGNAIDFRDEKVTFSQLIQRDVNYERVARMAKEYLEESTGRVVFFPPLLVSLIGFEKGAAKERYRSAKPSFVQESKAEYFVQRWDDFFEIRLPVSAQDLGHSISDGNSDKFFYNFGTQLRYNSSKVKLVVIDGQHRLEALRSIRKKDVAKTIEIPVCIVFPPDAVEGGPEDITADLRELFLTVNQEQQKVSGHFLTLLDDQRLSSEAIRLWGDTWKREIDGRGYAPLQLLEWNQRQERLENQVTRPFTITTISIVSRALMDHLFNAEQPSGEVVSILNLFPRKAELESHEDAFAIDEISDANYHASQLDILRQQMLSNVVPSLNVLFRELAPYSEQEAKVRKAFEWLDRMIVDQLKGYESYKLEVLQHFRDPQDGVDSPPVKDAGREFEQQAARDDEGFKRFFFYNVFQQGLIRVWIDLAKQLTRSGISPEHTARALVKALNAGFVKNINKILAFDNLYVRRTLFNGERVLINARSRAAWAELLATALGTGHALSAFEKHLGEIEDFHDDSKEKVISSVRHYAYASGHSYLDRYKEIVKKDLEKNYFDRDLPDSMIRDLGKLDRSGKPEDKDKFDMMIEEEASHRMAKARKQMALAIGLDETNLIANLA